MDSASGLTGPVDGRDAQLWSEVTASVEPLFKSSHRERWLRPIEFLGMDEGTIRLRAPDLNHKEWFENLFLGAILRDLEARTHRSYAVSFDLVNPEAGTAAPTLADSHPRPDRPSPPDLVPRFTFDRFVVGPTNQLAHAAALMAAQEPASRFNPLFICGGVGLGKTHLLHAVGHEIHRRHPDWVVSFVTCERFVNDLIGAIHQRRPGAGNAMEDFRSRYRSRPDVLLVDDVQFLSNKDSSQDEFFHTFNALHYAHKQIVLTADRLPQEIPGIVERLRSRFSWGLITEIEIPDLETRVAILKRQAESDAIALPHEVALYVGTHIKTNVRELEGALLRLSTRAAFLGQPLTVSLAQEALARLLSTAPTGLTIESVQREVAAYFDLKLADLKGPRRHRALAHPRAIAMYLSRKVTSMSYPEIGGRFGGRDHSTVISAVRKVEKLLSSDPTVRSVVATIEDHLRRLQ